MAERPVFSVAELAEILRALLEDSLPGVWVQGEVSNFRNPTGHWYFTLKDASAQLRCVMFKGQNFLVRPTPKNGDAVLLRGRVTFYPKGGDAQIVVEHMEPAGEGALLRAFEELKKKLAAEGLFDEKLKRPIPEQPHGIGVITSPTGAALQDILTTLRRRFPLGSVFVYPVPVQGEAAAPAIARALLELPKRAPADVIILARGGGSLEDLWAFNDERIARAIRACAVPVVTGIGHEVDFTISDFAADLRAPTPTAAAERVSPDQLELRDRLAQFHDMLVRELQAGLGDKRDALHRLQARLEVTHPGRRLQQFTQRLDELNERLRLRLSERLREYGQRLQSVSALLQSLGPQAVLARGYAIAQTADGAVLRDSAAVAAGETVSLTLARGRLETQVKKKLDSHLRGDYE
ncbi:MAG: exodeoxyribonuclease VII large subunit [Hydrocarboniphaga effusa]|nr:exodeoxyribonuclease VII large subunit [Hydrocarboniphaga effusa]